ncbi:MAG: 16S rRNA processing protein RimM [Oscillospiraceae bacterium]|nr:16S rRNA processing protein RimM [Ruminococcus sp.]MBP1564674.1 16S rRNA processing protein RimM [Oscillospiraceae bacterium]MBQ9982587.1 16S rRNA processing protein RimM [Oscillospiraceae bacterium]MBR6598830.1 16S rRNA processing protein RimM [Oscillospiraceae bacterium]
MSDKFLEVGKIVTVHALKGEVKIAPWCDSPDFICEFDYLYLDKKGEKTVDVEHSRVFKNMVIAKFEGYDTVEQAQTLRDKVLYISRDDVELEEGTYFIKDLIGLKVVDKDSGKEYGVIKDVFQTGANDVYTIKNGDKEYLIPAIADVVQDTDIEAGIMTITPLKGLFDDED